VYTSVFQLFDLRIWSENSCTGSTSQIGIWGRAPKQREISDYGSHIIIIDDMNNC